MTIYRIRGAIRYEDLDFGYMNDLSKPPHNGVPTVVKSDVVKSELDKYLGEDLKVFRKEFDILNWWKVNSRRFPIHSKIARDILVVPVSTVASESAFSTGGRVLDAFRNYFANWDLLEHGEPAAKEAQRKVEELERELQENKCKHETSIVHLKFEISSLHDRLEQALIKLQDYPSTKKGKKKIDELWVSQLANFKKSEEFQLLFTDSALKYYYHGYLTCTSQFVDVDYLPLTQRTSWWRMLFLWEWYLLLLMIVLLLLLPSR
ncbi:putative AC transposase [Sesamum angolense]|uniref:AC transposase n=1 Tax=Sesamum angolense TaxID=2727404 RepID=A0AAE1X0J3_9LAMI|nr:putative AC transposase [Sesamum angolense]